MPGTTGGQRANWSIALPVLLEAVMRHPLVRAVGECLRRQGPHAAPEPSRSPAEADEPDAAGRASIQGEDRGG